MNVSIPNCHTCPFENGEYNSCQLSSFFGIHIDTLYRTIPKECPLLKEPATVSLEKEI